MASPAGPSAATSTAYPSSPSPFWSERVILAESSITSTFISWAAGQHAPHRRDCTSSRTRKAGLPAFAQRAQLVYPLARRATAVLHPREALIEWLTPTHRPYLPDQLSTST